MNDRANPASQPSPDGTRPSLPGSRLYLHKLDLPPETLLDYLCAVYPHVGREAWRSRADRGLLTLEDGRAVTQATRYLQGETVRYEREVVNEPAAEALETILYEDDCLLVADKPHGMPVTPAGDYVDRSLLVRLKKRTGIDELVPAHRLDRDTAGVVVFVKKRADRGRYHALWSERRIDREYHALALLRQEPVRETWIVENRVEAGTPWFRQRIVPGLPNAVSEIRLEQRRRDLGFFHIRPQTGKKHQIRIHMSEIGYSILGDPLYPQLAAVRGEMLPLQLVAARLRFTDPVSGAPHTFASARVLSYQTWQPNSDT